MIIPAALAARTEATVMSTQMIKRAMIGSTLGEDEEEGARDLAVLASAE